MSMAEHTTFGGFHIGPMALAMPMGVLREVVPFSCLHRLPGNSECMLGALDLRGVLVPVIDLSVLFQAPVQEEHRQCVVVVAHEGRLFGIVATSVDCLFNAPEKQIKPFHSADPVAQVARGSLINPVSGTLLTVLCVESLTRLPQLVAVSDPEPHRQTHLQGQDTEGQGGLQKIPLLLMRSQGILFAVNPSDIETTMPRAELVISDVCQEHYKGNTFYRDRYIPAICLLEYLHMGDAASKHFRTDKRVQPAFVLRMEQGAIAVLIDEILDIVKVDPGMFVDLPAVASLQPKVLRQTIEQQAVYPDKPGREHYYLIHPQGLAEDRRLRDLAQVLHRAECARDPSLLDSSQKEESAVASDRRVIVFDMHGEQAIAIEQIAEVLHYQGVNEVFARSNPFRGIMTHRNRAIPVVDLAHHLGMPRQTLDADSNVLVVPLENKQLIGLAVGHLQSIEQAHWAPVVPLLGQDRISATGEERCSQQLVEVVVMGQRKLLEVVDAKAQALRFFNTAIVSTRPEAESESVSRLQPDGGPKAEQEQAFADQAAAEA